MELNDLQTRTLLQRDTVPPDTLSQAKLMSGKCILVTGAGGSIGSELSRIASKHAKRLVLLDRDEGRLYNIQRELCGEAVLDDLSDEFSLSNVFVNNDIDVVFHAAALKHVPILEKFPVSAFKVNVQATSLLVDLSMRSNVESFNFISTDKAVEPKSVMGRSKAQAEDIVRVAGNERSSTVCNIVRFGNVLGSSGSVLEIWDDQRRHAKPLSLTTPHMNRYFMSVTEAANLVINAASIGLSGTYVADMGAPISMLDMAYNFLRIFPSGCGIEEVEHRPGEKPSEKLSWPHEQLVGTEHQNVMRVAGGRQA
jgi:FlaA1/EpsC-like NDP-sugar epimerase